jgi:hypothetical protein
MEKSSNKSSDLIPMIIASCLGILGAVILAYSLSINYDVFNLYNIQQDGFNFSAHSRTVADPFFVGMFGLFSLVIGIFICSFMGFIYYDDFKKHFNKFVVSIPLVFAVFAVFVVNFDTKETTLVRASNEIYNQIANRYEDKTVFTNSIPAKEFQLALETKNFEALKVFINNPNKIKGLDESDMFNKLLTVQNISNKSVRDDFNQIYSDRFITREEYKSFKDNAMNSILQTLAADVPTNVGNDKLLITNL